MHVLITGASRGIGRELALQFSTQSGMHLYLISRSANKLEQLKEECLSINPSVQVVIIPFDLTRLDEQGIQLPASCGHLDILINNAGALVNRVFEELTATEITNMLDVNFVAPVKLIQSCLGHLKQSDSAHVVNIGSMGGFQGSAKFPGLSIYSSSKAALATLTECLAKEYEGKNISFNCLALGAAQTNMLAEAFPGYKAPLTASEMAKFVKEFALNGHKHFNGKIIPVSMSNP